LSNRSLNLLEKAFFEAAKGQWLYTAPNPRVGAIALKDGHIVGSGHHANFGGPHAEEMALRNAGAWDEQQQSALPGIVDEMVVTLEPCSSTSGKKRRPCTQSLLEAGVKKVTVAAVDPNPNHAGAGLDFLEAQGVDVDRSFIEAMQSRFEEQSPAFLQSLRNPKLPWVLLKWAATLDGKIATPDGVSQWITGAEARAEVHELRALGQATMVGSGTLLADDPELTARPGVAPARPTNESTLASSSCGLTGDGGNPPQPLRVCLAADIPSSARLLQADGPRVWILDSEQCPAVATDDVIRVERTEIGLDLTSALQQLYANHGVRRLLVEGGARLHGNLLASGLAHAIVRYEAPLLLGGNRAACDGPSFPAPQQGVHLTHEESRCLGKDHRRAFLCAESSA
jgi:diaminohydroxyphosphoribosylaminopyrimidine deaminase / 5-amino-6-(5-phosphoribosylamino)uracil reductase